MKIPKHLQVKKEHHYVWANYLRNWSGNNNVWFLSSKKKLICDSTKMIAKERFFYNMQPLTNEHIQHIKRISQLSNIPQQEMHLDLLEPIIDIQKAEALYQSSGRQNDEIEMHFAAAKGNLIEDLHTKNECHAQKIISELAKKNLSILDSNKNQIKFCNFLGHQFIRTKTSKVRSFLAMSKVPKQFPNQERQLQISQECWWFTCYMIGMNIGASLYLTRKESRYCMLLNNTDEPFITSDQPVINIHQSITTDFRVLNENELDLYYPISPSVALVLCKSGRFLSGKTIIDFETVQELNAKVAKNAHIHIFGSDKNTLKPYIKFVGTVYKSLKNQKPSFI